MSLTRRLANSPFRPFRIHDQLIVDQNPVFRGLRSTIIGAVKLVTHDERIRGQVPRDYRRRSPEDRGNQCNGQVFHDREGFTAFSDIKLFAIMKGARGCEVSGFSGATVTIDTAPGLWLS